MNEFFTQLARQSLTGGWMILALILLRPLIKKLPRWISCLLWALAAVRLVMPFSLESKMSLVPQRIAAPTQITPIIANIPMAQPALQTAAPAAAQHFSWQEALPVLWLIGGAVMVIYALVSYIRILKRVQVSIRVGDKLYLCDQVRSPFILGIFRPRIYLPSDMDEATTRLVLSHERTHLRRGDHLWKPLGYALLSIYWFNPLCALAYIFFCRDIEQACDEAVIKNMTPGDKKAYSAALLQCSLPGHAIAACPLAFGEVGVKQRIQGVLNYRKPKFWVMILSAVLCTVLAVGFLTDPAEANEMEAGVSDSAVLQEYPVYSSPSEDARILYQLVPGQDYTILSTQPIGDCLWAYVECQDGKTHGWMILGQEISQDILNSPGELGIFTQQTKIYSSPSLQSRELAQGEVGEAYTLIRWEPIGNSVWGYVECQDGKAFGWILLEEAEEQPSLPEIKVYSSPSENAHVLCQLAPEEDYTILERKAIGNQIWAYVECNNGMTRGWISMMEGSESDTFLSGTVTADRVNVRSGPGASYSAVGFLEYGTEVIILEVASDGSEQWGSIGPDTWVNMNYIQCQEDGQAAPDVLEATQYTIPGTLQPTTYDGSGEQHSFTQQAKIYSSPSLQSGELAQGEVGEAYTLIRREPIGDSVWGYVECQDGKTFGWILLEESDEQSQRQEIVVYRNPSEDSVIVCTLAPDEDYTILETQPIDNHIWGEIECQDGKTQGWILLANTLDTVITGTVSGPDNVNVRSGPGTLHRTMGYLEPGTEVSIFEVVTSDDLEWGRISGSGWVCMRYIEHGDVASQDTEITYNSASNASTESYTFSQETNVYSSPSEQGRIIGQAAAGEVGTITRREFIGNGSWAYLTCQSSGFQGWVHLTEEDEALNYFREYVDAYSQPEPDEVEKHLYFSSEYAREFFRDNYCPITGWYPSGIFRVNNNLWGIQFSDPASGRMVYSFVGRMDNRLYVFQNVRQVPEALSENLDVARYEEENAMYLSDEYMECYSVIKQLLPFANPTYVTVEDKGTKDYSTASPCPIEDVICGTDTWRVVPEPRSYGSPSCIITLAARDGSVATICDSSPVIAVSSAEGTQQWFQGYLTGEELVGMIYSWAKEIEWAPGE